MSNTSCTTWADDEWPPAQRVFCEQPGSVIPGVAEFFNALTALPVIAAGLIPMLMSPYVDELTDLASAACAINGVFSALVHAFPNRFFGTLDQISILMMALLYLKAVLPTQFPGLYRSRRKHALLTLVLMMALLISFVWNEYNVPKSLALEPVLAIGPLLMISFVYVWVKLMCNNATWHVGKLKRVILRGALSFILACGCWFIEELGVMPCPHPFTLHPFWHLFAAYALLSWTCFAKYHRGRFFGFRVELKGHWLCPYAVWLEPDDASSNAIVRHASSNDVPSRANNHGLRKNSYLQGQFAVPIELEPWRVRAARAWHGAKQIWRGGSFYKTEPIALPKPKRGSIAATLRRKSIQAVGRLARQGSTEVRAPPQEPSAQVPVQVVPPESSWHPDLLSSAI